MDSTTTLTAEERGLLQLRDRLELFAANCLKVLPKAGGKPVPLIFNRAQQHIHDSLEAQLAEMGYVRALLLKGRQQGGSTYVAARFYHKTTMHEGTPTFIVAHEDKATSNLFKMVKRFDDHNPLAPQKKASNAQELIFGLLDSSYKLATAGSKDVGRSNTARLFHGSEFAFWDNAQTHLAGIGNTIPSGEEAGGTEIILESTARGIGNAFHLMWQAAEIGEGEYIPIFVPWFWQAEYRSKVKPGFSLSSADEKYMQVYGLDLEQMQFRANKIAEYGRGFEWLFDQEYPATPALAFQTGTQNPLISPTDVMAAVNSSFFDQRGPVILGVDPAEMGADRTAFVWRQGRLVFRCEYKAKLKPMQIAGILAGYWHKGLDKAGQFTGTRPDGILIDKGGLGAGILDRLLEMNIPAIGVNAGSGADDDELYENKRAEMWWRMQEWFSEGPCRMVNDAALISDVTAPQPEVTSKNKRLLESKKAMKKRGVRSPDGGDALAMTFAYPVQPRVDHHYSGTSSYSPASTVGY